MLERITPGRRGDVYLCPDCGHDAFLRGPAGGNAQNVECAGCGNRFNILFGANWERLSTKAERDGART